MLNEQKIEEIRKKIQNSTILNDHEKSDWLNLLELMNDKQLGELEEILASEKPAEAPAAPSPVPSPVPLQPAQPQAPPLSPAPVIPVIPVATPSPQPSSVSLAPKADEPGKKMPPLNHISNMPTDVNMTHSVPPGIAPEPKPLEPKPVTEPAPSSSAPTTFSPLQKPRPVSPVQPYKPSRPKVPFELEKVEDLEDLNIQDLRSFDFRSISSAIKTSIAEHGYFPVLQLIEASPLYDTYLLTGEDQLNGEVTVEFDDPKRLTQEELEFMTDLLSNMRFNRL